MMPAMVIPKIAYPHVMMGTLDTVLEQKQKQKHANYVKGAYEDPLPRTT